MDLMRRSGLGYWCSLIYGFACLAGYAWGGVTGQLKSIRFFSETCIRQEATLVGSQSSVGPRRVSDSTRSVFAKPPKAVANLIFDLRKAVATAVTTKGTISFSSGVASVARARVTPGEDRADKSWTGSADSARSRTPAGGSRRNATRFPSRGAQTSEDFCSMILADTSVWVNHFRYGDAQLSRALLDGRILMHPFVIGEIACGSLRSRPKVLSDLQRLPAAVAADHEEVLGFLDRHRLFGAGIAWIDAHLLASARLSNCRLWTLDAHLLTAATRLHLG
jgi:predicted nucleic acid-binding protein